MIQSGKIIRLPLIHFRVTFQVSDKKVLEIYGGIYYENVEKYQISIFINISNYSELYYRHTFSLKHLHS